MSSFYDDASLVMIPSGYKNAKIYCEKPTDGSGDLTFTRASNATRVASNGLIEKVRTNLLLQSNTFSTTWTASNASVTSGQAGYDGTNNAWLLSKSAANGYISQGPASSGLETFSVYAKAGTDNWLHFLIRDSASVFFGGYFDLQNGVVGSAVGSTTLSIQSVGNGWYRCSASFTKSTSNYYRIYPAEGNNDTSGTSGNILIQNAQLEVGDIATQYIATTTTAVSVGPVSGLPRLDYLNSSCPRLLLEPQRTNDIVNNTALNNYTATRATWGINVGISPTGDQDAEKLIEDTTASNTHFFGIGSSYVSGTAYTWSIYIKADGRSAVRVQAGNTATFPLNCDFNLSTQTTTNNGSGTAAIIDAGNGWYRCVVRNVVALATGSTNFNLFLLSGSNQTYTGNGTSGVLVWGAQREVGAYETSVIPTLSTSVTRVADAASKTGISSLIGQTEGTLFVEGSFAGIEPANIRRMISISDGTTSNSVLIQNASNGTTMQFVVVNGGTIQATISSTITFGQTFKAAFAYKANDFVAYINGVQVGTDTSGTVPTCSKFAFDRGNNTTAHEGTISQALLFKTRLSNSDLATLTSL